MLWVEHLVIVVISVIDWKLVILVVVLLTSYIDSSYQSEIVTCCRGGNASFTWDYELLPFIVIEWYVNDTQIAETSEPSFSQNVLDINSDYTRRFRLHKIGAIGFDIINVTEADDGDYKCLVTSETGILKKLKKKLQVKVCNTSDTSTRITNPGERTTTPTPTEGANTSTILLGVLIPCGFIVLVLCCIFWRYKRPVLRWCNNPPEDESETDPKGYRDLKKYFFCVIKRTLSLHIFLMGLTIGFYHVLITWRYVMCNVCTARLLVSA